MQNENKKAPTKKQLYSLAALFVLLVVSIVYLNMDSSDETIYQNPDQPIEMQQVAAEENGGVLSVVEGNATELDQDSYLDDDIDVYFMTKAPKESVNGKAEATASAPLAKLPSANNGALVTLPNLTPPSQLPRGGVGGVPANFSQTGNIVAGMPTQISLPPVAPSYQFVTINGIACNDTCRASTSLGTLSKGSIIGGGSFAIEKIEAITMNGIKTDHRYISY